MAGVFFLIACMLMNTMSSCSMMAQSIGSVVSGTTYPSDDPEMLAVEADYAAREAGCRRKSTTSKAATQGMTSIAMTLDMIGHDPHELAAFLSAVLQGYTRQSAQAELERVFDAQYQLTLTEEVEIRYSHGDLHRPGDRRDHLEKKSPMSIAFSECETHQQAHYPLWRRSY